MECNTDEQKETKIPDTLNVKSSVVEIDGTNSYKVDIMLKEIEIDGEIMGLITKEQAVKIIEELKYIVNML